MIYIVITTSKDYDKQEHAFILEQKKDDWLFIDFMGIRNIFIKKVSQELVNDILSKQEHYLVETREFNQNLGTLICISCVSMIKLYLGINENFIFTIPQLRKYLNGYSTKKLDKFLRFFHAIYLFFNKPKVV